MVPRANNLPPDVRRQVLQQVENQLGYFEYQRLVGAMGEDGVLDVVLQQSFAPRPAPSPGRSTWSGPRRFRLKANDFAAATTAATLWTFLLPAMIFGGGNCDVKEWWGVLLLGIFLIAGWIWVISEAKWWIFAIVPGVWLSIWLLCMVGKFCERR